MDVSSDDMTVLRQLEEELWRSETRFDKLRMEALIAEDFFEYGRSGRVYQREDTLSVKPQPIAAVLPLPEFSVRLLNEDTAQTTYNSAVEYDGVVEYARRSSIWTRKNNSWVLRFHQGTPYTPEETK